MFHFKCGRLLKRIRVQAQHIKLNHGRFAEFKAKPNRERFHSLCRNGAVIGMGFSIPCLFFKKNMESKEGSKNISIKDLLYKKGKENKELSKEEIQYFVKSVTDAEHIISRGNYKDADLPIKKEQIGAMLMAIFIRGLDNDETAILTEEMAKSGDTLKWPKEWKGSVVDKHSTGGVGDKVSLVLVPALAVYGVKVPMISGRMLGHTGGTLDKLESIRGFNVKLDQKEMTKILDDVGCCIASQTGNLVPADKILYASRDATLTVMEFGLITGSIISKKLVESLDALVLDVKFGKGAFCETLEDAEKLAKLMVKAGESYGVKTVALLTDMHSPLGFKIGNALEVEESINCMKGKGPPDLTEVVKTLGGYLLFNVKKASSLEKGCDMIDEALKDGSALSKFEAMIKGQNVEADLARKLCNNPAEVLPQSQYITEIKAKESGFVSGIDAKICGVVASNLARMESKETVPTKKSEAESINHDVGLTLTVSVGHQIKKGDTWVKVHHNEEVKDNLEMLEKAIDITPEKITPAKRVFKVIKE